MASRRNGGDDGDEPDGDGDDDQKIGSQIPLLLGRRLPDSHDLDSENSNPSPKICAARDEYASAAIGLFLPYREMRDVRQGGENIWSAWLRQRANLSPLAQRVLENIQDYYVSKERARELAAESKDKGGDGVE